MRYGCGLRICISNKSPKMLRPQFENHHLGLTLPDFFCSFLIITIIIIILACSKHVWHKQSSFTLNKADSRRKYLQENGLTLESFLLFSKKLLQHPRADTEKSLVSPYWSCSSLEGRWGGPPAPASGPRILLDFALLGMSRQYLKSCWPKAFMIFFLTRMVWELGVEMCPSVHEFKIKRFIEKF